MKTNANLKQIPVGYEHETQALPGPAKILQFPSPQVDHFLGCCMGCGLSVYSGDDHRVAPELTCPECISEERAWRKVVAVYGVAA